MQKIPVNFFFNGKLIVLRLQNPKNFCLKRQRVFLERLSN